MVSVAASKASFYASLGPIVSEMLMLLRMQVLCKAPRSEVHRVKSSMPNVVMILTEWWSTILVKLETRVLQQGNLHC